MEDDLESVYETEITDFDDAPAWEDEIDSSEISDEDEYEHQQEGHSKVSFREGITRVTRVR